MLKSGGVFATFGTGETPENREQPVWAKLQQIHDDYFHPEINYGNILNEKTSIYSHIKRK